MALAAAMVAACSKEESGPSGPMQLTIDPTITRATEVDFETGDAIGVTVTTAAESYVTNRKFVYGSDSRFTGEESLLWYEDVNAPATLFAYYPYSDPAPAEFTVKADQGGDGYDASDLMTALKTGVYPTKNAVGMTFRHKMSRLVFTIDNETDFPVTQLVVTGTIGTAVIDAATNTVTVKADAATQDITAREVTANSKYYALIVPQSAKFSVTVTTAEGTRSQSYSKTELEGGKSYPVTVRVKPTNMEIAMEGPIEGWEDAEEIPTEGQGTSEAATVEWGGVKYKIVTLKDGRTWMAENLRYIPDGMTPSSDPADGSGVWYPCNMDKAADPDLVESSGLFYSYPVLLGLDGELTAENYNQYEGVQGICPDGWHIPTMAEWLKLCGSGSGGLSDPTAPYYDASQSGAYLPTLNADGFNIFCCGYINATSAAATPAYFANKSNLDDTAFGMGYYAGSTAYKIFYNTTDDPTSGIKNIQFYAAMLNNASGTKNSLAIAYQSVYSAVPVRCIKDAE